MQTAPATLRIACRRHDWTNALFEGQVGGEGYRLDVREQANVGAEGLIGDAPAADYAECGLTGLLRARAAGVPVIALPIFIRSAFRHSYILARTDRGIDQPRDLEGKRVGTRYNMTATVWARGLLQHDYGVQLEKIHWLNQDAPDTDYPTLPAGIELEPVDAKVSLADWLREGKIDALVHATADLVRFMGDTRIKRLFPNAGQEERRWWQKTGVIPMMNVIACHENRLKERPDEVRAVFDAFVRAKQHGLEALLNNRDSGLFFYWEALEDQIELMRLDPVPYSVKGNQKTIDTLLDWCAEQGIVSRRLAVDEIFYSGFDA